MKNPTFVRRLKLCKEIVILDGLTGTGKTMFTPLLSSLNRMQNARFEYMFEYLAISAKMSKISVDASTSLLNLLADVKYYDGEISREVNFRPRDLSSVFNSSKSLKYLKQLWLNDGLEVEHRINNEKPILLLATHQLIGCFKELKNAFRKRLRMIEMVRHPLYLLDHWESYIMMHGNNPRDFTIWLENENDSIPWFAKDFENLYLQSNSYDRAAYSIEFLMKDVLRLARESSIEDKIKFIPFEKFVLYKKNYIKELEGFLKTTSSSKTNKVLRKQKVPRATINDGPQKNIYKRYALGKYQAGSNHEDDYNNKVDSAKQNCSLQAFEALMRISKDYEEIFGLWF